MRVMIWTEQFYPHIGGIERMTGYLAQGFLAQGHSALIVTNQTTLAPEAQTIWQGVPVRRLPTFAAFARNDTRALRTLAAEIVALRRAEQPDIVHIQLSGPAGWLHTMTNHDPHLPTVVASHSPLAALKGNQALTRILQGADGVVVLTHRMQRELLAWLPQLTARTHLISIGIPLSPLQPAPLPFAPPVVLGIGRLVEEKGFDLALRAFAALAARHTDLQFWLAGDGPERGALETLAAALGLRGRASFLGWVAPDEVPTLINKATLVIVPSRWQEPSATVLGEAAQMGRPVVASAVGGTPELVLDGATGLLVPNEDVAAMAAAMEQLLTDPAATTGMGLAARTHALHAFSLDRYVTAYIDLFTALMDARRQQPEENLP